MEEMKKQKRASISLGIKIFCIASSMLVLLIVVAYFSCSRLSKLKDEVGDLKNYLIPITDLVTQAELSVGKQGVHFERLMRFYEMKLFNVEEIKTEQQNFEERGDKVDEALRKAILLIQKAEQAALEEKSKQKFVKLQPLLESIGIRYQSYYDNALKVIALLNTETKVESQQLEEKLKIEREQFGKEIEAIRIEFQLINNTAVSEAREHQQGVINLNYLVTGVAVFIGLLIAFFITIGVVKPVRQLMEDMQEVGRGNLDVDVKVTSLDEIGVLAGSFGNMVNELKLKERIKDTFGKYVDPRVVENIASDEQSLDLRAQKQVMTVMFTDIEGFDEISKKMLPSKFVQLTNNYLNVISKPVSKHNGVIDKFIETTVMAFWGPPFTDKSTHAQLACQAAIEQIAERETICKLVQHNTETDTGLPRLSLRIGISTGSLVVGNMGSEQTKSYTVIGDTVNIASRLNGVSLQYDTPIIIAEDTKNLVNSQFETREIDLLQVVGKEEPVRVYELVGKKGEIDKSTMKLKHAFGHGLREYRNQAWDKALLHFKSCLKMKPDDGPSAVYIKRVQVFRKNPPDKDWSGVWLLTKK
jgi:class 3 adenylate cyclase